MSHHGRSFPVFRNKFFIVTWVRDHFIWITEKNKLNEFRLTPDGHLNDARFVAAVFDEYWNDGRITDAEYKELSSFREDVKHGKFNRPIPREGMLTSRTPWEFNPSHFIHSDAFDHGGLDQTVIERTRAALQTFQGFAFRSEADCARNS